MSFAPESEPFAPKAPAKPEALLSVPVGLASPLWGLFAGAAMSGAAWWWMTRWTQPKNLEAMFGAAETAAGIAGEPAAFAPPAVETVEVVIEATPEPVIEAFAETPPEPVMEAVAEAAPEPVVEPLVEEALEPVLEAPVEAAPESVAEASWAPEAIAPEATAEAAPIARPRKKGATQPAADLPD